MGKLRVRNRSEFVLTKDYIKQRLEAGKIVHENGCWSYYGCSLYSHVRTSIANSHCGIHVLSGYIYLNHDLNSPLMTLHKCGNGGCWNPEHLYKGNHEQNMQDCIEHGKFPASSKTHCRNGHEFKSGSFRMRRGWRECLICIKIHNSNRRSKRKAIKNI